VCRDPPSFVDHSRHRLDYRAANRHRRTRCDGAGTGNGIRAVAQRQLDLLDRDAEALGDEPPIERCMPLAARLNANGEEPAAAGEADPGTLARLPAGDLQKARDPEPAALAGGHRAGTTGRKAGGVCARQRSVDDRGEIAAVVGRPDRRVVGHHRRGDQVAAAQFDAVDPGDPRSLIDQPLEAVIRLRPAGAPIRPVGTVLVKRQRMRTDRRGMWYMPGRQRVKLTVEMKAAC
jgi:hypothetical protein